MFKFIHLTPLRISFGFMGVIISYFFPIKEMLIFTAVFIGIDFFTGCIKSYAVAHRNHHKWIFSSEKAWRTIAKCSVALLGISLGFLYDKLILNDNGGWGVARAIAAFICGVEFWSWIENAAYISGWKIFLKLREIIENNVQEKTGLTIKNNKNG